MLRTSTAASCGNEFAPVRASASYFTAAANANSCSSGAFVLLVDFAQGDWEMADIPVLCNRREGNVVQKLKNVIDVLKHMCLLEGLKSHTTETF